MSPSEFKNLPPRQLLSQWRLHPDGSWSPIAPTVIGDTIIGPDTLVGRTTLVCGIHIAGILTLAAADNPEMVQTGPGS